MFGTARFAGQVMDVNQAHAFHVRKAAFGSVSIGHAGFACPSPLWMLTNVGGETRIGCRTSQRP
jgi:hypothetical protein